MHASDPAAVGAAFHRLPSTGREANDALGALGIGETALLPLLSVVRASGGDFELWGKAEFSNPTGSVKDRTALAIVRAALSDGRLGNGRTLLDASSGNTAVAYARLGEELGFSVALLVPKNVNAERLARMRAFGATVVFTDPLEGTDGAQRSARQWVKSEPDRFFYADQYNNPANPFAHYSGTGPEIWRQSSGRLTHFVAGVGTGGTLSGAARFLREQRPNIGVIGVQPDAPLHGIGGLKHIATAIRPGTYDDSLIDRTIEVSTEDAQKTAARLSQQEGLRVGVSSGAAVFASLQVGRSTPGAVIVTILPDGGETTLADPPQERRA